VRVPAAARRDAASREEHTIGVVLLSCGHPDVVVIHPRRSIAATLKRYDWECPNSGSSVTAMQVLAVLSSTEVREHGSGGL
jgi:hypothetical protein